MLAALVSGIVIHRRIFREFFTFRPRKHVQRSALDLHNLTGVVALPFHFFFALTGLTIFAGMYFPVSETMLKPQAQAAAIAEATSKGLAFKPSGIQAPLASVDAMVLEAKRRWAARGMPGEVGYLYVNHVGDRNSYVTLYRAGSDRVTLVGQAIHFEGTTGRVLFEEPPPTVVSGINDFLTGLHLQQFEHWLLRWLYVFGGLSGCVCIATGFIFFVEKRKRQHAKAGVGGARWADAMAVATVTGMIIATLSILIANRVRACCVAQRAIADGSIVQRVARAVRCRRGARNRRSAPELGDDRRPPAQDHRCTVLARGRLRSGVAGRRSGVRDRHRGTGTSRARGHRGAARGSRCSLVERSGDRECIGACCSPSRCCAAPAASHGWRSRWTCTGSKREALMNAPVGPP
jgi:hypothetical protein